MSYLYSKSSTYGKNHFFFQDVFLMNGCELWVPPGVSDNLSSFEIINILYFTKMFLWHFLRHYYYFNRNCSTKFTLISMLLLNWDINKNYNQIKCTCVHPSLHRIPYAKCVYKHKPVLFSQNSLYLLTLYGERE